jgi:hypothetical protein
MHALLVVFPIHRAKPLFIICDDQHSAGGRVDTLEKEYLKRGHDRSSVGSDKYDPNEGLFLALFGHDLRTGGHDVRKPLDGGETPDQYEIWISTTTPATEQSACATRVSMAGSSLVSRQRAFIAAPFVRRGHRGPRT